MPRRPPERQIPSRQPDQIFNSAARYRDKMTVYCYKMCMDHRNVKQRGVIPGKSRPHLRDIQYDLLAIGHGQPASCDFRHRQGVPSDVIIARKKERKNPATQQQELQLLGNVALSGQKQVGPTVAQHS
ncbi:unnamed protein product [Menidia menidia]|uniref:(Atlantic silverside) hypothetical protein n=1 Tax=Menidia menidia TaxID=238744 RepID=A0A8S4AVM0_9TELE|nr:unnamed protein product [Menidia menidia]